MARKRISRKICGPIYSPAGDFLDDDDVLREILDDRDAVRVLWVALSVRVYDRSGSRWVTEVLMHVVYHRWCSAKKGCTWDWCCRYACKSCEREASQMCARQATSPTRRAPPAMYVQLQIPVEEGCFMQLCNTMTGDVLLICHILVH